MNQKSRRSSCGYFKNINKTIIWLNDRHRRSAGRKIPEKSHEQMQKSNSKHSPNEALLIRFILHMSLISPWECASRIRRQPSTLPPPTEWYSYAPSCVQHRFVSHINKHSIFFFRLQMKMWLARDRRGVRPNKRRNGWGFAQCTATHTPSNKTIYNVTSHKMHNADTDECEWDGRIECVLSLPCSWTQSEVYAPQERCVCAAFVWCPTACVFWKSPSHLT